MLKLADLKARGWSDRLIKELLGEPDQTARNPVYRTASPVRLYSLTRVVEAEANEKFVAYQSKRAALTARSKAASQKKRDDSNFCSCSKSAPGKTPQTPHRKKTTPNTTRAPWRRTQTHGVGRRRKRLRPK